MYTLLVKLIQPIHGLMITIIFSAVFDEPCTAAHNKNRHSHIDRPHMWGKRDSWERVHFKRMTSTYIYNCKFRHSSVRPCLVVIESSFWVNSWPLTKLGSIGTHQRREKQSKQWTSFNKTALKKPSNIKFDRKWQLLCWSNVPHEGNEMATVFWDTQVRSTMLN